MIMKSNWFLRHKIIYSAILLLFFSTTLIVRQSAQIEKHSKEILLQELNKIFNQNDFEHTLISATVGEGNDSWFEYNFELEVLPRKNIIFNHNAFYVELEQRQRYVIKGTASFAGNWFDRNWQIKKLELTAAKNRSK